MWRGRGWTDSWQRTEDKVCIDLTNLLDPTRALFPAINQLYRDALMLKVQMTILYHGQTHLQASAGNLRSSSVALATFKRSLSPPSPVALHLARMTFVNPHHLIAIISKRPVSSRTTAHISQHASTSNRDLHRGAVLGPPRHCIFKENTLPSFRVDR